MLLFSRDMREGGGKRGEKKKKKREKNRDRRKQRISTQTPSTEPFSCCVLRQTWGVAFLCLRLVFPVCRRANPDYQKAETGTLTVQGLAQDSPPPRYDSLSDLRRRLTFGIVNLIFVSKAEQTTVVL